MIILGRLMTFAVWEASLTADEFFLQTSFLKNAEALNEIRGLTRLPAETITVTKF